jgi:hypothetical protein
MNDDEGTVEEQVIEEPIPELTDEVKPTKMKK